MKNKIIARLKQIGKGYDLDKLPPALLNSVIESSIPFIELERQKAEDKAIQKLITERFVAKAIRAALEKGSRSAGNAVKNPQLATRKSQSIE